MRYPVERWGVFLRLINQFLVLGLDESASDVAIGEAFHYLSKNLNPTNFPSGSSAECQAQQCMSRIVPAYKQLIDDAGRERARQEVIYERSKPLDPDEMKPFLGHICVAAGIINIEDLIDAISTQGDIDLPLGQILQEKALLSQTELDGLLMGQRLFGSPGRQLDSMTRRLLNLNAVSRDMVKIVMIDQRTNFVSSLPQLLIKRGWLSDTVYRVLEDQTVNRAGSAL